MEHLRINELKKGWCVNHPKYGNIQYRGLATRHPYTEEPKIPHLHIFWQCVDEDGNIQPDVIEKNGMLELEVTDKIGDNE